MRAYHLAYRKFHTRFRVLIYLILIIHKSKTNDPLHLLKYSPDVEVRGLGSLKWKRDSDSFGDRDEGDARGEYIKICTLNLSATPYPSLTQTIKWL
jgi:hypothetical protein